MLLFVFPVKHLPCRICPTQKYGRSRCDRLVRVVVIVTGYDSPFDGGMLQMTFDFVSGTPAAT